MAFGYTVLGSFSLCKVLCWRCLRLLKMALHCKYVKPLCRTVRSQRVSCASGLDMIGAITNHWYLRSWGWGYTQWAEYATVRVFHLKLSQGLSQNDSTSSEKKENWKRAVQITSVDCSDTLSLNTDWTRQWHNLLLCLSVWITELSTWHMGCSMVCKNFITELRIALTVQSSTSQMINMWLKFVDKSWV